MAGTPKARKTSKAEKAVHERELRRAREVIAALPMAQKFMNPTLSRMGRAALGLSAKELADAIGITRAALSNYERGSSQLRDGHAQKINQHFRDNGLNIFFTSDGFDETCGISMAWDFLSDEPRNPEGA